MSPESASARTVIVDGRGRAAARRASSLQGDAGALASRLCRSLGPLVGTHLEPLATQAVASAEGPAGLVLVRELGPDGAVVHSAAVAGADPTVALIEALFEAAGVGRGVLVAAASRWASRRGVRAVTVVTGSADHTARFGGADMVATHVELVTAMPGPGRMNVVTVTARHDILRLAEAAIVITYDPEAGSTADAVERWMDVVEVAAR